MCHGRSPHRSHLPPHARKPTRAVTPSASGCPHTNAPRRRPRSPSKRRFQKIVDRATAVAGVLYLCVGILGSLQFIGAGAGTGAAGAAAGVQGNILNNYPTDDTLITVGRVGLSLTVSIGIALMVHPLRNAWRRLAHAPTAPPGGGGGGGAPVQPTPREQPAPQAGAGRGDAGEHERSPLSAAFASTATGAGVPGGASSPPTGGGANGAGGAREILEAVLIQSSGLLAAIFIPEITTVWSLMGSTVCMLVGYVLPAACYLALRRWDSQTHLRNWVSAWALAVAGSVLTVVCTACTLMQYV